jgi:ferredoxin
MRYQITIDETGAIYHCDENESLLDGMMRLGAKGIPQGCCGGGCGVCKIEVVTGAYHSKVMSRQHVTLDEQRNRLALACRVLPQSDLTIRILGKMQKNVFKYKPQAASLGH